MKKFLLPYLYFTRAERRGALALVLLITGFFLWPLIYQHWYLSHNKPDPNAWNQTLSAVTPIQESPAAKTSSSKKYAHKVRYNHPGSPSISAGNYTRSAESTKENKTRQQTLQRSAFPFDPNTATEADLLVLGFSKFCVKNMLQYRAKGGRYTSMEKLAATYGMDAILLNHLAPLIQFPTITSTAKPKHQERKHMAVDINTASEEALDQLPGIGPVLAKRIIQYRNALGGFLNIPQLGETYGLQDSVFQKMIPLLTCPPGTVKTIDINTVDEATLAAHPYCSKKQASILIAYRQQHGAFINATDLDKVRLPEPDQFKKILPYLKFQ